MLVLRKEIKMGLGVGAAVLGIAGVYGLMALLSSGSGSHATAPSDPATIASTDNGSSPPHGLDSARKGLPPPDEEALKKLPVSEKDPFAESERNDGNKADPWTLALSTGKIPVATAVDRSEPLVVAVPKAGSKPASGDLTSTLDRVNFGHPGDGSADSSTGSKSKRPADAPASAATKYVIKSGDTFSTIAAKELGGKRFASAIVAANPNIDPRRLRPGTEISLPAKDSAGARGSVEPEQATLASPIDAARQYRVAAGDTLHRIATRIYGKSAMWLDLYDANKTAIGTDAGKLKLGMVLTLPKTPQH